MVETHAVEAMKNHRGRVAGARRSADGKRGEREVTGKGSGGETHRRPVDDLSPRIRLPKQVIGGGGVHAGDLGSHGRWRLAAYPIGDGRRNAGGLGLERNSPSA